MNTDARRAVFCAVMGAEDCMDAFERLLKLQLKARHRFSTDSQGQDIRQPVWNADFECKLLLPLVFKGTNSR